MLLISLALTLKRGAVLDGGKSLPIFYSLCIRKFGLSTFCRRQICTCFRSFLSC